MTKVISCDLHDYLEIACMYQYQVELLLVSGDVHVGVPKTTKTAKTKEEFLVFQTDNNETLDIDTSTLQSMTVLTKGAKFTKIDF